MTTTEHSSPPVRHPPARSALTRLRQARERFLAGRPLPDGVPEEIASAWRRARFFGVRPDAARTAPLRPPESALAGTARPVLERLVPALDGGRSALVLTDERLRVLWTAGSAPHGTPHPDLSEQRVGHNSAALALRTGRRAEVHGPEHFLDAWQDVSAVSAPVRAPGAGRVLGTVTVASPLCAGCGAHPAAALVEAAAAAVETELAARSRPVERVLLDAHLAAAAGQERAVVTFGGHSRLVSEAAGRLLSAEELRDLERGVAAALRQDPDGGGGADGARGPDPAGADRPRGSRAVSRGSYEVRLPPGAGWSAKVTPVRHRDRVVGAVAVLGPVLRAPGRAPVPADGPGRVALAGRSVPWRHAVGRAAELAASRAPLLIVGERGTGKTALACELLGDGPVVDAAEGEPGGVLGRSAGHGPLVLRHVERLAQPDVATLISLLEARPDTPLLATYTPGMPPGPCLQRLLDTLAARSVVLPALRERPEDIEELLLAVAPGPAPGRPPLTWTLDALRALRRYRWPGNVTELAHVVRSLAEHRRATGPVRRAELPDAVREGPAARPLSPMEDAERTTILEALRRHGGNKARTAAALGIGRATLYRKLRRYRS
ncbi:helix-turn-helix domain-containing protein [Streptomyces glaucus]|uniref:Helix-turn-helix domain-containing protein n=1 Tax=Streptomyces glaucus TaxID=284029 RepID=A0ABN3K2D9_9ACTN